MGRHLQKIFGWLGGAKSLAILHLLGFCQELEYKNYLQK